MRDYLKRFLIVGIVALCISLLFLGGTHSQAQNVSIKERTEDWIWPTEGVITDIFGSRGGRHKGIDIAGVVGTPILAVASGTVSKSYYSTSYGHVVFIKHEEDKLETVYAHLNKRLVKEGQKVAQGAKIGEMGNTGHSSGSHLHFEIHQNEWTYEKNQAINPADAFEGIAMGNKIPNDSKKDQVVFSEIEEERVFPAMAMEEKQYYEKLTYLIGERQTELLLNSKKRKEEKKKSELKHEITSGETLWAIANQYEVTVASIKKENNLKSDLIFPGQTLTIQPENMKIE